jgi:hypothetical protein
MKKKITKKDQDKITKLFEDGKDLQAENFFVRKYITAPAKKMQGFVSGVMERVQDKILSQKQMQSLTITVSNTMSAYDVQIRSLYNQYSNMFAKYLFQKYNITTPFVKQTVRRASIATFNASVKGALSQTNTQMLTSIRKYQTDLIKARQRIDTAADVGRILKKDVAAAYNKAIAEVNKINPAIGKMKQGNFVVYRDGSLHTLESYTDMATRTTLLNVDRTSVEVKSGAANRRVVEYYLRDKRAVKEKRAVCNSIMHTRIKGIPMVALDQGAADVLGIRTLEQAKQEDGKAFGPNCRHSIKPLSQAVYNEIEKVLFIAEAEVA